MYCIGIITTVKRRQEFRIRLQRRARRRVEKLLEGAEDERQRQLVGVHFAVSLSQFSVDTDTCSKMSDNVAYLANQARFYIGWIRRGAAAPVFSQAPVLPPMQVITLQRVLIGWEGFGNGDLELTVDTFQELAPPRNFRLETSLSQMLFTNAGDSSPPPPEICPYIPWILVCGGWHLYWVSLIRPTVDCSSRNRTTLCFMLVKAQKCATGTNFVCRGVDLGVDGLDPGQSMFWPPKRSHSFIQNCCWITQQLTYHQGWKTCRNGR